jgi:hypothetical protein
MASAVVKNAGTLFPGARMPGNATGSRSVEVAAVSSIAGGGPPLALLVARGSWRAGKRGRQRISRGGRRLNSRGRGCPRSWRRLRLGNKLMALWAGCLARHARLSPFVGVGAGLITGPVGIGKDGGHGGWLVLGVERWRCGLQGDKNRKKRR